MTTNNELCLPTNYLRNPTPDYYVDAPPSGQIWQPDVYEYAYFMCKEYGIKNLIDIGSGNGQKLAPFLESNICVHTLDYGPNLEAIRNRFAAKSNLFTHEVNLDNGSIDIGRDLIEDSLIICSDVIEHLQNPQLLITWLSKAQNFASMILLSTPDRDRVRGYGSTLAPGNPYHIQEWTLTELLFLLKKTNIFNTLYGHTAENNLYPQKSTSIIVFGKLVELLFKSPDSTFFKHTIQLETAESPSDYLDKYMGFWKAQNLIINFEKKSEKNISENRKTAELNGLASEYIYAPPYINGTHIPLGNVLASLEAAGYTSVSVTRQFLYKDRYKISSSIEEIVLNNNPQKKYPIPLIKAIPTSDSNLKALNSLHNRTDDILEFLNPRLSNSIYRQNLG